jgi:hypothetical protein
MFIFSLSIVAEKMNMIKSSFPIASLRLLARSPLAARGKLFSPNRAAFFAERLGSLVLARIARVLPRSRLSGPWPRESRCRRYRWAVSDLAVLSAWQALIIA